MREILCKRVYRDFKSNYTRYLALGVLITMCIFMVVSLLVSSETIIYHCRDNSELKNTEDGEFSLFVPLSEETYDFLLEKDVILEEQFYMDYMMSDNSILRVFAVRDKINTITLDEGHLPTKDDEIVIEKRYAEEHSLSIAKTLDIEGNVMNITGIGCTPDYEAPLQNMSDSAVNSKKFGTAFVTKEKYTKLREEGKSYITESYIYAYCLDGKTTNYDLKAFLSDLQVEFNTVGNMYNDEYWKETIQTWTKLTEGIDFLKNGAKELSDGLIQVSEDLSGNSSLSLNTMSVYPSVFVENISIFSQNAQKLYNGIANLENDINSISSEIIVDKISNLEFFCDAKDNPRINAAVDDRIMKRKCGIAAGVIVMLLMAYVISVFVIHSIEREKAVIGTLYALGVRRRDLIIHYLAIPVFISLFFSLIGIILGLSDFSISKQLEVSYNYFSIPKVEKYCPLYIFIYSIIMPITITVIVNFGVIWNKLNQPVLNMFKTHTCTGNIRYVSIGNKGFINCFRIRHLIRESRILVIILLGIFCSLLITILSIDCYVVCDNLSQKTSEDIKFKYMYTYKYPEKECAYGGEPAFLKKMKKSAYGYTFDISFLGIEENNPFFDIDVVKGKNRIYISSAVAQKFRLKKGDNLIVSCEENGMDYIFYVEGIYQYSAGFFAFMDLNSMRELFNKSKDYSNVVFSDRQLDITADRLYAIVTKENLEESASIFGKMIMPMFYTLIICSVVIFSLVMYFMIKVMIDRSTKGISLLKVMGFKRKELKKLYFSGVFSVVMIGSAICIVLSKKIIDTVFPILLAYTTCSLDLSYSPWYYMVVFLLILILYIGVEKMLINKVDAISMEEVLKDRE